MTMGRHENILHNNLGFFRSSPPRNHGHGIGNSGGKRERKELNFD